MSGQPLWYHAKALAVGYGVLAAMAIVVAVLFGGLILVIEYVPYWIQAGGLVFALVSLLAYGLGEEMVGDVDD